MNLDPATEQMLAKPELLEAPVFSREGYLAQAGQYLLGCYLRLMQQSPELCKQVPPGAVSANSHCTMVRIAHSGKQPMIIAWTYDFEARGLNGALGRDLWIKQSKPSDEPVMGLEQISSRRVVDIQVEDELHKPQPLGGGSYSQIVRLKRLGWFAVPLIGPARQAPPARQAGGLVDPGCPALNVNWNIVGPVPPVPKRPRTKRNWWKLW